MLIDDRTGGLSREVIGIAITIHRKYGPGLVEAAYLQAYVADLRAAGYTVDCQPQLALVHAGAQIANAYRPDVIVNRRLVLEVKSVAALLKVHTQQLKTYMRLAGIGVGLLIDVNVTILRYGIKRVLLTDR
jgi:GxxExxY protein